MPVVYVICPDHNTPSGGVKKLYEVVDTLNNYGIKSFIVHHQKDFRVNWFRNSTKIIDLESANIRNEDLLIIPEIRAEMVLSLWPGIKKIIFCQNSFNTFIPFHKSLTVPEEVYLHRDIVQVMVVSDHDYDALYWLFPGIKLSKICIGINDELFYFNHNKKKLIAFMSRRGQEDYTFIDQIFKLRDPIDGFSFLIIDNLSIEDCAEALRESAIFLSFSPKEGFGLPIAEAMACGCIVIGYHGQGGKEFFKEDFAFPIEQSDLWNYAKQVSHVVEQFINDPLKTLQIGKKASDFILNNYSIANQTKSILQIITPLI